VSPAFDGREGNPGLSDREREGYYATWRNLRKWKTGQHVRFWKGKGLIWDPPLSRKTGAYYVIFRNPSWPLALLFLAGFRVFVFLPPHFVLLNSFWEYRSSLAKNKGIRSCKV